SSRTGTWSPSLTTYCMPAGFRRLPIRGSGRSAREIFSECNETAPKCPFRSRFVTFDRAEPYTGDVSEGGVCGLAERVRLCHAYYPSRTPVGVTPRWSGIRVARALVRRRHPARSLDHRLLR